MEVLVKADPGARTPISASRKFITCCILTKGTKRDSIQEGSKMANDGQWWLRVELEWCSKGALEIMGRRLRIHVGILNDVSRLLIGGFKNASSI